MRALDPLVPLQPKQATFVAKKSFGVSGNLRVLAEALAQRSDYEVHLYYEGQLDPRTHQALDASNIRLISSFNLASAIALASSSCIIVDHSVRDCYITHRKPGRRIVNIWHGVPIKRIELAMPSLSPDRRRIIEQNSQLYDMMIASNEVDRLAISACFGIAPQKILACGLPRYDILDRSYQPPADLEQMLRPLLDRKGSQKLLLYAPTFRENAPSPFEQVGSKGLSRLSAHLEQLGVLLALRPHHYDRLPGNLASLDNLIVVSKDELPETNLLLRHTDILVTDFSSLWVDYLLLNRPIIGFSPDFDHYKSLERDFLYDFPTVFPGTFCHDIETLCSEVSRICRDDAPPVHYDFQKKLLLPTTRTRIAEAITRALDDWGDAKP
jgi:CDP-glycerol glycerophosphotransferase (TagB/SpsB family)